MAEAVGVIASGISIVTLAAQIAGSLIKFKAYWDEIKDAPEDITSLIDELDDLSLILSDIEEDQRRNPVSRTFLNSTAASKCLDRCRKGTDRLKELVDDLNTDIHSTKRMKHKWASTKVLLKKEKIDKYKARLERAIRLLSLSHQCYTRALSQLQPEIIISSLAQKLDVLAISNTQALANIQSTINQNQIVVDTTLDHRTPNRKRKQPAKLEIIYRTYIWLVNWAWDIDLSKSRSGWTFKLRTYRIIPDDLPAFELVYDKKNVKNLERLLAKGEIYPNNCCVTRWGITSLLERAITFENAPACKLLIAYGADPNLSPDPIELPIYPMHMLSTPLHLATHRTFEQPNPVVEILHILAPICDIVITIEQLEWYTGTNEEFLALREYLDISYYDAPLSTRVEVALWLLYSGNTCSNLIKIAMCQGPLFPAVNRYSFSAARRKGLTLFHAVARAVGWEVYRKVVFGGSKDLEALLRELILNGADLHAILIKIDAERDKWSRTPFLYLIEETCVYNMKLDSDYINQMMDLRLEDLESTEVDLLQYGKKEEFIHAVFPSSKRIQYWAYEKGYSSFWESSLVNFTYGASRSDWRMEFSEPKELKRQMYGQEKIYRQETNDWSKKDKVKEMAIPGSWVE